MLHSSRAQRVGGRAIRADSAQLSAVESMRRTTSQTIDLVVQDKELKQRVSTVDRMSNPMTNSSFLPPREIDRIS